MAFNLTDGQLAERKSLITIAEWDEDGTAVREILGIRTPDSSIEYNVDSETTTDIRGNNYTDINSTQPQQDFDPFYIRGGSALAEKLDDIRRRNALTEFNQFTCYIVTEYSRTGEGTTQDPYAYPTEKHTGCTISVNSIGGDTRVNMPISVYFSNKITLGTVDKIAPDFVFTADTSNSSNG